jgi:plasmid stability protein
MAQAVTIRQIPDDVHRALKARAARSGRSVEAEIRQILADTCLPARSSKTWLAGLAERARIRTADKPQTDSAILLRQERDARQR